MRPSARALAEKGRIPPGGFRDFVIQGALRASSETVIRSETLLGDRSGAHLRAHLPLVDQSAPLALTIERVD